METFEGIITGVGLDINSREQQENNARTNQQEQEAPQDVIYDNRTAEQEQNQYKVSKADTDTHATATGMTYKSIHQRVWILEPNKFVKGILQN